ncbi:MAG: hypothetical protein FWC93_00445 [Defluviitaleaceae bacterium]|nr:hypothetical protein [Defluviitaleaceae bacterium]
MKRFISIILALCLAVGASLPVFAFLDDFSQYVCEDESCCEPVIYDLEEDAADPEPNDIDTESKEVNPEHVELEDDAHEDEGHEDDDHEDEGHEDDESIICDPEEDIAELTPFIFIAADVERNITIITSPGIYFEIVDENAEEEIVVILTHHDMEIEIAVDDITVILPDGWAYVIGFDNFVTIVTLYVEEEDTTVWHSIGGHIVIYEAACNDDEYDEYDPPQPLANVPVSLLHGEQLVDTTFTDESGQYYFLAMSFDTETLDEWSVVVEVEGFETESAWLSDHAPDYSIAPANMRSMDVSHIYIDFQLEVDMAMFAAFSSSFTPIEIPDTADFFEVTNETQLRAALASTGGVVAVRIMNDIEISTAAAMPITNGGTSRIVHIYSNTDGAFSIIRTGGTGRHINISGNRQLHLWNVTLTRPGPANPAGNGGGINVEGTAHLHMHAGSTISNNRNTATFAATQGGGGIRLAGTANATINDGAMICDNIAAINGGGIFAAGGSGTLTMNGGTIENNRQNSTADGTGGGGVFVYSGASFTMRGGYIQNNFSSNTAGGVQIAGSGGTARAIFNMSGGQILYNEAAGAGGGVHINTNTEFHMSGDAVIHGNEAAGSGGGVRVFRGTGMGPINSTTNEVTISDNARISGNRAGTTGGGLSVGGGGTQNHHITINSGTITGNIAVNDGGGIFIQNPLATGYWLRIFDGSITNNTANNGGGLFIPHASLGSVTIAQPVVFVDNVARNGVMIDNSLHHTHYPRIGPDTVSVAWIEEISPGSGIFREATPHAFTNYDINVVGPRFWRVTYEVGEGDGEVSAYAGSNQLAVANGIFVPHGEEITFTARPERTFSWWNIGTRPSERTVDGSDFEFNFTNGGTVTPLLRTISMNTHMIGHFEEESNSKLTISKRVRGMMGNMVMAFEFNVYFRDSNGNPLPEHSQFYFSGSIIPDSGATAPLDGVLTLDSEGRARFMLSHGQAIIIDDVPLSTYVQVIETPDTNHVPSFVDSENEDVSVLGYDTTSLPMSVDRAFHFTNERFIPPPTGINIGDTGVMLLMLGLAMSAAVLATGIISRRRKVFRRRRVS